MNKKQFIILWASAAIITFISGYLESITDKYFPLTGTIGIEGKKVSYKFDRFFSQKENYKFIIRTDLPDLEGKVIINHIETTGLPDTLDLVSGNKILFAEFPRQKINSEVEYYAILYYKDKKYVIPEGHRVRIKFSGYVPSTIRILFLITLFGGLLFSVRTAFEYFSNNLKTKKMALFTLIFWAVNSIVITPLKRTYELDAINNLVPAIESLFEIKSLIIFFIWIICIIGLFNLKNAKIFALAGGVITVVTYILLP